MNIQIDNDIANQDNSVVWTNPILKTRWGKLLLLPVIIFFVILFFSIDFKQLYYHNKIITIIQAFFLITSIAFVIVNFVISRINVYKIETAYKEVDYDYYREILKETSSGVLSFVYNKKIRYKDILISTLLKFEKEKIIKIDYDNKCLEILSDVNTFELSEYEKYILEIFKNNSENGVVQFSILSEIVSNDIFRVNVRELIKRSSKEKGYYKANVFTLNIIVYYIFINFAIMMISFFMDIEIGLFCFMNMWILFYLCYIANLKTYIKTKEGQLLSDKLNGLKNYLVECSMINDRRIEEIHLWDYYMIYAIIFDLKGNLDKDVNTLYNVINEKI